jgi:hypothetical protein
MGIFLNPRGRLVSQIIVFMDGILLWYEDNNAMEGLKIKPTTKYT